MATETNLSVRIKLKYDSYANWTSKNPTLLDGEVAVAYIETPTATQEVGSVDNSSARQVLMKVGPGAYNSLQFISAKAADVHAWAKKPEDEFKTWVKSLVTVNDIDLSNYYTKTQVDAKLEGKVDQVTGKSLIADTEITRLAAMSDGANKVEASTTNGNIKIDGVETTVYTHPAKHAISDVTGLQDALNAKVAQTTYDTDKETFALKTDVTNEFKNYVKTATYTTDKNETAQSIANVQGAVDALEEKVGAIPSSATATTVVDYVDEKVAAANADATAIGDRVTAIEEDYLVEADKTELSNLISAEKERAEGIEENLQTQINTIMNNPDAAGAINSINEFTKYVTDHGTIADGFRVDIDKNKEEIAANAKAISDQATADAAKYETKTDASQKLTDANAYTDAEVAKDRERLVALEAIDHDHANKSVLDGINANKVAVWDAAEQNAKDYADDEIEKLNISQYAKQDDLVAHTGDNVAHITADERVKWNAAEQNAMTYAKDYSDGLAGNYATSAQGTKADTAIQRVTSVAGNGIKATTNGTAVTIDWDDSVTLVFDCGNASV